MASPHRRETTFQRACGMLSLFLVYCMPTLWHIAITTRDLLLFVLACFSIAFIVTLYALGVSLLLFGTGPNSEIGISAGMLVAANAVGSAIMHPKSEKSMKIPVQWDWDFPAFPALGYQSRKSGAKANMFWMIGAFWSFGMLLFGPTTLGGLILKGSALMQGLEDAGSIWEFTLLGGGFGILALLFLATLILGCYC
ncbi:hypothetical protein CERSUDRAFT_78136 [Gelatoporia subvermispora B]|uniref:Uncharacterized protein n=1 Tax=Ceriporiopsis subvermispora (strain B) TaxID=914234 RepID=M2QHH9_CERS8|nr:hypothetical protein CERSUDRAFT_78136 [Gelatoporia subvermispora B]